VKLRASWGQTGNNSIGNYSHIATVRTASAFFGQNEIVNAGILPNDLGNQDLGWEKSTSTNIGIDIGLMKDRINLSVEAYNNITSDLLLNVPIPWVAGFGNQLQNIGEVRNRGWEFDLNTRNTTGAFQWTTRLNLSINQNEVLSMGPDDVPIMTGEFYAPQVSFTGVGHPIGSFFMLTQEGIFQTQEEVDNSARWGNEGVGDVKFRDVNGDGVINNDDREVLGQPFPIWNFGFTNDFQYKNFDLRIFINGAGGHKTYFATGRYYDLININNIKAYTSNWNNRWRSEQDPGDGRTPNVLSNATSNGDIPSTRSTVRFRLVEN
jgi:TonB-dependent starch-binding outer membrane protein SusC